MVDKVYKCFRNSEKGEEICVRAILIGVVYTEHLKSGWYLTKHTSQFKSYTLRKSDFRLTVQ